MTVPTNTVPPVTPPVAPVPTPPVNPPADDGQGDYGRDLAGRLAKERSTAERATQRQILEALGVTSVDDAVAALTKARELEQAHLTEQQKATQAAEAARVKAEAATAAAAVERHGARIDRALYAAGIPPVGPDGQTNPNLTLAARLVEAAPDGDDAAVAAAVQAVKAAVPAWFLPVQRVPSVDPGRPPAGTPSGVKTLEEMRNEARRYHGTAADTAS